jgi:hypothetical protein
MVMRALTAVFFTACVLGTTVQQPQNPSNVDISTNFNNLERIAIGTRPEENTAGREILTKREDIELNLWTGP